MANGKKDTKQPSEKEAYSDKGGAKRIPVKEEQENATLKSARNKFSVKRIAEIYEDGGKPPDMSKIIRRDPNRTKKIFIVIIVALAVLFGAALWGLKLFNTSQNRFSGKNVELTVKAEETVTSGDEMKLMVTIRNDEQIILSGGELTILYPTNFRFDSAQPAPFRERNNVWDIGDIRPGGEVIITISGSVIGEVGDEKVFSMTYSYIPENFSSEFEESLNFTATVGSSILNVNLDAPIRVGVGKESELTITYSNESDEALERIRFTATYPEGFSVIGTDPEAKEGTNVWEISSLGSGEEGIIRIRGTLAGSGGDTQEFKVQAGLLEADNTFRLQVEKSALILLLEPELSLTLSVDGSESGGIASLGDLLSYTISYINNGDVEVKDVQISLSLTSDVLNWDGIIDPQNGALDGNTVTWTTERVQGLESIKAGEGSELSFSIPLLADPYGTQEVKKNVSITTKASATSTKITDLEGQEFTTDSNTTVTKVATDLNFRSEARYYNDELLQVGHGPTPPVVGQSTTYRIFWNISNTSNEVTDVIVSTTLPSHVLWTGTTSVSTGEQLIYDQTKRSVTWEISRIPVGAGILFGELEAYFDVTVTPKSADVGNILLLTEASTLTGTDSYTEEELSLTQELQTTQLDSDPQAMGQGIVETAE